MKYFLDTNILLDNYDWFKELFNNKNTDIDLYIPSVVIFELDNIKMSKSKDDKIKSTCRKVIQLISQNMNKINIVYPEERTYELLRKQEKVSDNNDGKILSCAYYEYLLGSEVTLLTNDILLATQAAPLGIKTKNIKQKIKINTGVLTVNMNDDQINEFYGKTLPNNKNIYNLTENEYLTIIHKGDYIETYKFKNNKYQAIKSKPIISNMFGKISPKDYYQTCAIDSLKSNKLTVIKGTPGSGKSLLSMAYLFHKLERNEIDKIIMFVNPVATKDSCKFGFLPGTALEKILGSQIGNFLSSKIGDMVEVERLIRENKLELLPIADIRGVDFSEQNIGIYVTEAQNTTVDMMKLILTRVGKNNICILEGDDKTQVDYKNYEGDNNGLTRVSQVFKGQPYYGEVTLKQCYRSEIAERAELL